jgi:hypothetical protein
MQKVVTIQLTPEELGELVRVTVMEAVRPLLATANASTEVRYYTRNETAKKLGVSLATLWAYDREGILVASRVGRRVLYREGDIEQALLNGQIKVA